MNKKWINRHLVASPTYFAWTGMKDRVKRGHVGVGMCQRWESFDAFVEDIGAKPKERGWQLSRLDHFKGFYKENCLWEPRTVFRNRMGKVRGDLAEPIDDNYTKTHAVVNGASASELLSKLDDIEKRAESGEEEGLNMVDAHRLLKEAAQATRKALKAVAVYR